MKPIMYLAEGDLTKSLSLPENQGRGNSFFYYADDIVIKEISLKDMNILKLSKQEIMSILEDRVNNISCGYVEDEIKALDELIPLIEWIKSAILQENE